MPKSAKSLTSYLWLCHTINIPAVEQLSAAVSSMPILQASQVQNHWYDITSGFLNPPLGTVALGPLTLTVG